MNTRSPRAGDAVRIVLIVAFILLAIPALLISLTFLGYRTSVAQAAEEEKRAAMAQDQAAKALERARRAAKTRTDGALLSPSVRTGSELKPVMETEYRRESVETYQPVKDPVTGRITYKQTQTERLVPVTRARYLPTSDPSIVRLLAELQDLDESDEAYDRKMEELRTRVGLQFDSMHEAQANEIAKTEERLKSLKELHRKRGESKDKIVQRRMDELLGRDDALRWEVTPSPSADASNYSTPLRAQALAPPTNLSTGDAFVPRGNMPEGDRYADMTARAWPPAPPLPPLPSAPVSPPASVPIRDHRKTDELMPPIQLESDESRRFMMGEEDEIELVDEPQAPGLSSPTIVRLFELARQLSSSQIIADTARDRMLHLEKLVENRLLPSSEFKQEAAKLARIERELELHQMELEALDQAMHRNQRAAAAELSAAEQELRRARQLYNGGRVNLDHVNEVDARRKQALVRAEEAKTNIDYLKRIRELLRDQQGKEVDADASEVFEAPEGTEETKATKETEDRSDKEAEADEEGDPRREAKESPFADPFGSGDGSDDGHADPFGGRGAEGDPFGSLHRLSSFRLAVAPAHRDWPAS